jgi:hypothetical protein
MYVQHNWLTALRAPVLGVLITLLGFQMAGFAQFGSTGRIVGVVKDESGAVVPQVSVTATNTETGRNVAVQTTDVGAYVVQGLLPGKYSVIFEKASFSKLTEQQVTVDVNQDSTVDAVLKVGASAQTITVQAGAELVQNTSAALTSTVDQKRIRELPVDEPGSRRYSDQRCGKQHVPGTPHYREWESRELQQRDSERWADGRSFSKCFLSTS